MRAEAALLALLAIALAWPVPLILATANWPPRAPRSAILLWQAIGLTGGLAAVGALIAIGVAPLGSSLRGGLSRLASNIGSGKPFHQLGIGEVIALIAAVVLLVRLLGVLLIAAIRIERDLRRQRRAVDLVASEAPREKGLRILDHPMPAAYCLPGARPRIVITEGTISALEPSDLAAVLEHEQAHARGRHELVVQPFVAWESALPFLKPAHKARTAVAALVEMLADDAAARRTSRPDLARALARIGGTGSPGASTTERPATTLARVTRLVKPCPPAPWHSGAATVLAVALVALPTWLVLG